MAKTKPVYKLADLLPVAEKVSRWVGETGQRVTVCGSLRRGKPVVGDIDLVISGPLSAAVLSIQRAGEDGKCEFMSLTNLETCQTRGHVLVDGVQIDLYVADHEYWGAMTLFLTGSKVLNILMRQRAIDLGYKLNQYGLFHNGEIIAGKTEEQVFAALGIEYLKPCDRSLEWGDQLPKEAGLYVTETSRKNGKQSGVADGGAGAKGDLDQEAAGDGRSGKAESPRVRADRGAGDRVDRRRSRKRPDQEAARKKG